jgi:hypothetical protein
MNTLYEKKMHGAEQELMDHTKSYEGIIAAEGRVAPESMIMSAIRSSNIEVHLFDLFLPDGPYIRLICPSIRPICRDPSIRPIVSLRRRGESRLRA